MKRRLTGWLAWGLLAVVIAVPSSEIIFSKSEQDAAKRSSADQSANTDRDARGFFGPMPVRTTSQQVKFDLAGRVIEGDPVATVSAPSLDTLPKNSGKAEAPSTSEAEVPAETDDPVDEPRSSIVELAVLQPPLEAEAETDLEAKIAVDDAPLEIAQPAFEKLGAELSASPPAILGDDEGSTALSVDVASRDPAPSRLDQDIVGASEDAVEGSAISLTAPQPMPASMRPASRVVASAQSRTYRNEDVRRSVENIEKARGSSLYVANDPYFDDEDVYEDDPYWDDAPRRIRLDEYRMGEYEEDDASNSSFYRMWVEERAPARFADEGSFSRQLPARRGNSVRLDLAR